MPKKAATRAAWLAIAANLFLLILKGSATGLSDSLTIFSETLNSLADLVSSVVVLFCIYWAWKTPDETHPFGHRRAEPVAGLLVAIFTGILGFEVCRTAVIDLWQSNLPQRIGPFPIAALVITVVVKLTLAVFFYRRARRVNSPALRATAVDCRNDVLISAQGLVAVLVAAYQLPVLDRLAAFVVGVYILYSGYRIGMENLDYLMGRAPDLELLERIKTAGEAVPGVQAVADVRGHYVGTLVHVELTVMVDQQLSTLHSHDVGEETGAAIEAIGLVDRAFVHIEPMRVRDSQTAR
jgi:cation diffusion facilitator family transporter